ncbi:MAG: DUF5117 domain-containing protein, partial [Pirellulales bacterium]|nr:DUF5117 domain-containing protein [Pirellulales bacterium]
MRLSHWLCIGLALVVCWTTLGSARADDPASKKKAKPPKATASKTESTADSEVVSAGEASPASGSSPSSASRAKESYPPADKVLKGAQTIRGLITMHRKDGRLFGEISSSVLNKDFLVAITIARGIGERPLLGGHSWGFGDDWIWQFRKVDNRIQVVRRNVRFTAAKGSPTARAVELGYTDSVLFSLPILAKAPGGGYLVDLNSVFMGDLPRIGAILKGFLFSRDRSTWATVKGFKDNVELQVAAVYASNGSARIDSVPDSRGLTVYVHYSISRLPQTGYKPRLADDRIGYFLTVVKDYSKKDQLDKFVRYVNRWDLQKADPTAKISPPKRPIIFWLE